MIDVLNLALPFFGLIFLGFACGKFKRSRIPGLPGWISSSSMWRCRAVLPHPRADPAGAAEQPAFIVATISRRLGVRAVLRDRHGCSAAAMAEATIARLAGGYGNIGYMGPGLALATLGRGHGPGRADLLFRHPPVVFARAVPDDACRPGEKASRQTRSMWSSGSCCIR